MVSWGPDSSESTMCANIAPRKPTPESRQPARKPVRRPRAPRCEPELAARFRGHQRAGGKLLRKCFVKTRFHHDFSARTAGSVSGKTPRRPHKPLSSEDLRARTALSYARERHEARCVPVTWGLQNQVVSGPSRARGCRALSLYDHRAALCAASVLICIGLCCRVSATGAIAEPS